MFLLFPVRFFFPFFQLNMITCKMSIACTVLRLQTYGEFCKFHINETQKRKIAPSPVRFDTLSTADILYFLIAEKCLRFDQGQGRSELRDF